MSRPTALDCESQARQYFRMTKALEEITKDAMDLSPRQRIALAGFLLETADSARNPEAETAWDTEIEDRIRAIDDGRVTGIAYEDVLHEAAKRLSP